MNKYRVWCIVNPPNEPDYFSVANPQEGADVIKTETKSQSRMRLVFSNVFGLEVNDGSGWTEWYNEVGEDVNEAFGLE